jgi:hypothetical protein
MQIRFVGDEICPCAEPVAGRRTLMRSSPLPGLMTSQKSKNYCLNLLLLMLVMKHSEITNLLRKSSPPHASDEAFGERTPSREK